MRHGEKGEGKKAAARRGGEEVEESRCEEGISREESNSEGAQNLQ
jgi:hypothetical protein